MDCRPRKYLRRTNAPGSHHTYQYILPFYGFEYQLWVPRVCLDSSTISFSSAVGWDSSILYEAADRIVNLHRLFFFAQSVCKHILVFLNLSLFSTHHQLHGATGWMDGGRKFQHQQSAWRWRVRLSLRHMDMISYTSFYHSRWSDARYE